jgi:hypothetical protein
MIPRVEAWAVANDRDATVNVLGLIEFLLAFGTTCP